MWINFCPLRGLFGAAGFLIRIGTLSFMYSDGKAQTDSLQNNVQKLNKLTKSAHENLGSHKIKKT